MLRHAPTQTPVNKKQGAWRGRHTPYFPQPPPPPPRQKVLLMDHGHHDLEALLHVLREHALLKEPTRSGKHVQKPVLYDWDESPMPRVDLHQEPCWKCSAGHPTSFHLRSFSEASHGMCPSAPLSSGTASAAPACVQATLDSTDDILSVPNVVPFTAIYDGKRRPLLI